MTAELPKVVWTGSISKGFEIRAVVGIDFEGPPVVKVQRKYGEFWLDLPTPYWAKAAIMGLSGVKWREAEV